MEAWAYGVIALIVLGLAGFALVMFRRMQQMQVLLTRIETEKTRQAAQPAPAPETAQASSQPQGGGDSPMSRLAGLESTPAAPSVPFGKAKYKSFDPGLVTKVEQGELPGLEQLENALTADPKNVELLETLAYLYYCSKNLEKAIETYCRAIRENPSNEVNHYYLANAYYLFKQPQQAIAEWGQVEKVNPTSRYLARARERIEKVKQAGWVTVE